MTAPFDARRYANWLIAPGVDGGEELSFGLRKKRLKNIGIPLYQLHHSAHPGKRTREWREREQLRTTPAQLFAREYDLAFEALLGRPVFANLWFPEQHVVDTIPYDPHLSLIAGFDFGLDPTVVLFQLPRNGDIHVFAEILPPEPMALVQYLEDVFWPWIGDECAVRAKPILASCDPAGEGKDQASGRSPVQVLVQNGLPPILGPKEWGPRFNMVAEALKATNKEHRRIRVSAERCPRLVAGFNGGYRLPAAPGIDTKKLRPVKDQFSHVHDAFQYGLWRCKLIRGGFQAAELRQERPRRDDWRPTLITTQGQEMRRGQWRAMGGGGSSPWPRRGGSTGR